MEAEIPASVLFPAISSLLIQHFSKPGAGSIVQATLHSGGVLSGLSPQST